MERRNFLIGAAAGAALPVFGAPERSLILLSKEEAGRLKRASWLRRGRRSR